MKAMNSHGTIPSVPIVNVKDHSVVLFDLTSMRDANESSHYPQLVGERLRLELNFTFPLDHVNEPNI